MLYDVLSRIVHSAFEGSVQLRVSLFLKMPKNWDIPVQILVLLKVVFMFELFWQAFNYGVVFVVLELIANFSLMAEVTLYLPSQLFRHWIFLCHPSQNSKFPLKCLTSIPHFGDDTTHLTDVVCQDN